MGWRKSKETKPQISHNVFHEATSAMSCGFCHSRFQERILEVCLNSDLRSYVERTTISKVL